VGSKLISVAREAVDVVEACGAFVREMTAALQSTSV